jgi:hypothetical protein
VVIGDTLLSRYQQVMPPPRGKSRLKFKSGSKGRSGIQSGSVGVFLLFRKFLGGEGGFRCDYLAMLTPWSSSPAGKILRRVLKEKAEGEILAETTARGRL